MKKVFTVCLILVFASGCASMTDRQKTKSQGAAAGAGAGAVVGAIVGQLLGGDTESTLVGAGIGAIVGGGAGGIYANHVANKKEKYASDEDYLNACIASARDVNIQTRKYNVSLRNKIRVLDDQVSTLIAKYNRKQARKSHLAKKQRQVKRQLDDANKKLQRVRDEITIQREVMAKEKGASKRKIAELNSEIAALEGTANDLEGQTEIMAGISQSLSV